MNTRVLLFAICLTATCLFLAARDKTSVQAQAALTSATTPPTEKWEYCKLYRSSYHPMKFSSAGISIENEKDVYEEFKVSNQIELYNKLGSEGWELVGFTHTFFALANEWEQIHIFKRSLPRE